MLVEFWETSTLNTFIGMLFGVNYLDDNLVISINT